MKQFCALTHSIPSAILVFAGLVAGCSNTTAPIASTEETAQQANVEPEFEGYLKPQDSTSQPAEVSSKEAEALSQMAGELVEQSQTNPNQANGKLQVLFTAADQNPNMFAAAAGQLASRMVTEASTDTAAYARAYQLRAHFRDYGTSADLTNDLAKFAIQYPDSELPLQAYKRIASQLLNDGEGTTALAVLQHGIKHCGPHRDVELLKRQRRMTVQTISLLGSTRVTSHIRKPLKAVATKETQTPSDSKYAALVGQPASVTGATLQGSAVTHSQLRGEWVFVHFWATWCGACRSGIPDLVQHENEYSRLGVKFVGVNMDTDKEMARDYVQKQQMDWPQIETNSDRGWDAPLAKSLGIKSIPTALLIGPDGKIAEAGRCGTVAKSIRHHVK